MAEGVVLDADQAAVVQAPAPATQIVIAGPGAGKSQVVGERCKHLVEEGVDPGDILVISFSNAAVDVVRARTRDVAERGRSVDTATLDSLAARVRSELEEVESAFLGFDDAIARATALLLASDEVIFEDVEHVIVDEAQDVVGVRVDFVVALLGKGVGKECGWTVLGDPMQGIYDFQDGGDGSRPPLVEELRSRFVPEEITLKGEYRAETEEARNAALMRPFLLGMEPSDRLLRLRDLAADLVVLGEIDEDAADDISVWSGTTALLCDTNARAGIVADRLAAFGVPVELASSATDPVPAPWIAVALQDHPSSSMDFSAFAEVVGGMGLGDASARWRELLRISRSRRDLEINDLVTSFRSRRCPPLLLRRPEHQVIASTVHRAKGLEFDNVVLVDPDQWTDHDGPDALSRRLFVALSRSRVNLTRSRGTSTRPWRKRRQDGLWERRSANRRGTTGVLLEPRWCRALGPAGAPVSRHVGAVPMWTRADDLVTTEGDELPSWVASVDGDPVARTGEEFGLVMSELSYGRMPHLLGGRVEGLETVVGPWAQDGPGRHGVWLGARISGPVTFEWE